MKRSAPIICGLALVLLQACASSPPELTLSEPDRVAFEVDVYPVLLRDCGFYACHGSDERFLQVFGPGRERLSAETPPLDPPLPQEIAHSFERARSMIDSAHRGRSLLLIKPLSVAAGGAGHEGVDSLGRNVYSAKTDQGYAVLASWVQGLVLPPPAGATTPPPTP